MAFHITKIIHHDKSIMNTNTQLNPDYKITFGEAINRFWRRYAQFSGRATRSEYWFSMLFLFLAGMGVGIVSSVFAVVAGAGASLVTVIWDLVIICPSLSIAVRRVHDVGKSGVWVGATIAASILATVLGVASQKGNSAPAGLLVCLFGIATIVLGITVFVFCLMDSDKGENRYGASEKYLSSTSQE